jgi:AcrR family transcriptional regulator
VKTRANNKRQFIVDTALALMAERGVDNTSMRTLADACELNVAALYHYFPSKADLLSAVIAERQYEAQMAEPPVAATVGTPEQRLAQILATLYDGVLLEEPVWRLVLAESCRGHAGAVAAARQLIDLLASQLRKWVIEVLPELTVDADLATELIVDTSMRFLIDVVLEPETLVAEVADHRAAKLAPLLFPVAG